MSTDYPPYMNAYGNIEKTLNKIIQAQTPPRFTQDFLGTTLGMTGGGARPIIPFLKRLGFIGSDGVPTDIYKRFRNEPERGAAAAEALREGYKKLYAVNEYTHDADDKDLHGLVIQVTGLDANASTAKAIVSSFNAVKKFANFNIETEAAPKAEEELDQPPEDASIPQGQVLGTKLGLSYTINLNRNYPLDPSMI